MKSPNDETPLGAAVQFDWSALPCEVNEVGVIIVDHGSRREASNQMLPRVVQMYRDISPFAIVEPAHMELADPSIADAFTNCVKQEAKLVVVHPYFLLPGRHWDQDIPRLAAAAAVAHECVPHLVTSPLSLHPLMAQVIQSRVEQCLAHATGQTAACELCDGTDKCQVHS